MSEHNTAKNLISQGMALYREGKIFESYRYFCNHVTRRQLPQWYYICMNMVESLKATNVKRCNVRERKLRWFDEYRVLGNKNKRRIVKILYKREGRKYTKPSRPAWTINNHLAR